MDREEAFKMIDELTVRVWNQKEYMVVDELFCENFIDHDPMPGQGQSRQNFLSMIQFLHMSCQDLHVTNNSVHYDEHDGVVTVRWSAVGSGKNSLLRFVIGTGPITMKGIDMFKVRSGRFTEHWGEVDASVFFN